MTWSYRLIKPKDKWIPRFAEVYYTDEGTPEFWSIHKYFGNIIWSIVQPLSDAFKRKPLKESDFKKAEDDFEFSTVLEVEKDGEDYFITLPDDLTKQLGYLPGDQVNWVQTEYCHDDGEYPSFVLENPDLEARQKAERQKNKGKA